MIRNQRPAVARCGALLQNRTESFQKPVSIGIVFKNALSLDTPAYDIMQRTRRLPANPSPPASTEQASLRRGHCGKVAGRYFA